jgi:addiction module HigA family antidote
MTTRATLRTTPRTRAPGPISRADLDAGRADLSEVDSGTRLAPVHPGEVLRHEFLEPLGLSAHALALALRVPANRISEILSSRRAVTAETALRLARHFGTTPGFWLNLQKAFELERAERQAGARIRTEVAPRAAT